MVGTAKPCYALAGLHLTLIRRDAIIVCISRRCSCASYIPFIDLLVSYDFR